jgi:hypothetical protein
LELFPVTIKSFLKNSFVDIDLSKYKNMNKFDFLNYNFHIKDYVYLIDNNEIIDKKLDQDISNHDNYFFYD